MAEAYGVAPGVEHYGRAINMLGHTGRLDEIEALVAGMLMPPDAVIWGSLLVACRACGNIERAERVMCHMVVVVVVDHGRSEAGDHTCALVEHVCVQGTAWQGGTCEEADEEEHDR